MLRAIDTPRIEFMHDLCLGHFYKSKCREKCRRECQNDRLPWIKSPNFIKNRMYELPANTLPPKFATNSNRYNLNSCRFCSSDFRMYLIGRTPHHVPFELCYHKSINVLDYISQ